MDLPICTSKLLDQDFGMSISPDSLIVPFQNFFATNYFRPWKIYAENLNKEIGSTVENTKEKFKIMLDVQHFKPNELSVKIIDNAILIEGRHEERKDEHGFISRQFMRRYALPKDCLSDNINSALSSDGVLIITANKISDKDKKTNEKVVPIKMCEASAKTEQLTKTTTENAEIKSSATEKNQIDKTDSVESKTESNIETKIESNKDEQIMLKDEQSSLLNSELLKESVSKTDNLIKQTKMETEELLRLITSDKAQSTSATAEKLEDAIDQCKTTIAEIKEKMSETCKGSSETFSAKCSIMSESSEIMDSSSFKSSSSTMSSTLKASSETANELLISAELKDAAEIK